MVSILVAGIVGGLAATLVMTVMMKMMMDGPLPTAIFASKFLNDKPPEENAGWGMALHLLYGTVVGVVFVYLLPLVTGNLHALAGDYVTLLLWGLGYGILVWMGGFVWMMIIGMMEKMEAMPKDEKMKMMMGQGVMHLVYGAVLGIVVAGVL